MKKLMVSIFALSLITSVSGIAQTTQAPKTVTNASTKVAVKSDEPTDEATERVLRAMQKSGKPMKVGEITEATGINNKEVDKVLKRLKTEAKIFSPRVCFYQAK